MNGLTKTVMRFHRAAASLHRRGRRREARAISALCRTLTGVEIHPAALIGDDLTIAHGVGLVIGPGVRLGDRCLVYHGVTLGDRGGRDKDHVLGYPTIGDDVVLYAGAKVLGPVTVADHAMVGANAVVVRDVPAWTTVTGIPAR